MEAFRCSTLFKLAQYHHRHRFIRTAVDLAYKILGKSANPNDLPIFVFHGLLGGKRHWEGLGKQISKMTKRKVIIGDLRNHGDSPQTTEHNYTELAGDIIKLYETLKIDRASCLGHSMGGRSLMAVSLIDPEKVASLVVVDISPVSNCAMLTVTIRKVLDDMATVDFGGSDDVKKTRAAAIKKLKPVITDDLIMKAILSNINKRADGSVGYLINLATLINNFDNIASFPDDLKSKKYDGPTLFIGGKLSEFIPTKDLDAIRTMFPNAQLTYVEKAGHNVHFDDTKTFLEISTKFLRENK